jgi:hypothetical protein
LRISNYLTAFNCFSIISWVLRILASGRNMSTSQFLK